MVSGQTWRGEEKLILLPVSPTILQKEELTGVNRLVS